MPVQPRVVAAARHPFSPSSGTIQERVNQAVASLEAICVGAEKDRIYFEVPPKLVGRLDEIARSIIEVLASNDDPDVRAVLDTRKGVTVSVQA